MEPAKPEGFPEPKPPGRGRIHWVIALSCGVAVFLIATWSGYIGVQEHYRSVENQAIRHLQRIRTGLDDYHSSNGKWPEKLE